MIGAQLRRTQERGRDAVGHLDELYSADRKVEIIRGGTKTALKRALCEDPHLARSAAEVVRGQAL